MHFKFAHMADVHLGAFRDPLLRELNLCAFEKAADKCIELKVDFIIIAGDLFEIALPDMAVVNRAARKMKELIDSGIPIYAVYGSHDYSPNETSVIDVLSSAGLIKKVVYNEATDVGATGYADDVTEVNENGSADADEAADEKKAENKKDENSGKIKLRLFCDEKTGAQITGLSARKREAEKAYYANLDHEHLARQKNKESNNENNGIKGRDGYNRNGFRIFAFHSTVNEMKPDFLALADGIAISQFPKGFCYYAGGHVHKRMVSSFNGYGKVVFPGALFGRDYRDLENASKEQNGFYIVSASSVSESGESEESYGSAKFGEPCRSCESCESCETCRSFEISAAFEPVCVCRISSLEYNADGEMPTQAEKGLLKLAGGECKGCEAISEAIKNGAEPLPAKNQTPHTLPHIVLLKVSGELSAGKPSDINFEEIKSGLISNGASAVYVNRNSLSSKEAIKLKVSGESRAEIERKIFKEHLCAFEKDTMLKNEKIKGAFGVLRAESLFCAIRFENAGEAKADYDGKIKKSAFNVLEIGESFE